MDVTIPKLELIDADWNPHHPVNHNYNWFINHPTPSS